MVVADINGEGATAVANEIAASGGKAISAAVDITSPESVAGMVKTGEVIRYEYRDQQPAVPRSQIAAAIGRFDAERVGQIVTRNEIVE